MVPHAWPRGLLARWFLRFVRHDEPRASDAGGPGDAGRDPIQRAPKHRERWRRAATFRRLVLMGLIVSQTYIASNFMVAVLPYHGRQPLEIAILILFAILFGWISAGFWTAMAGFVLLVFGSDRYAISDGAPRDTAIDPEARVAIIMPICNENVSRVFAGLAASYESLARTGELKHFDFFVLSDSSKPDIRVAELDAWLALCRAVNGFRPGVLSMAAAPDQAQERQHRRFLPALGKPLPLYGRLDADSIMSECLAHRAVAAE
jgi:membrane glycosyltransferase